MKRLKCSKKYISEIIDTMTDPEEGAGILGYVVAYSDGSMENKSIEYDRTNYKEAKLKIYELYQKDRSQCNVKKLGNKK